MPPAEHGRALAGEDVDLLREVCGLAVGYYRGGYSAVLCDALEAGIDWLGPWIELGRRRRARGVHGGPEQRLSHHGDASYNSCGPGRGPPASSATDAVGDLVQTLRRRSRFLEMPPKYPFDRGFSEVAVQWSGTRLARSVEPFSHGRA